MILSMKLSTYIECEFHYPWCRGSGPLGKANMAIKQTYFILNFLPYVHNLWRLDHMHCNYAHNVLFLKFVNSFPSGQGVRRVFRFERRKDKQFRSDAVYVLFG